MTIPCQFSQFPPNHWLMVVCLNRVCLRGLTVDAAMEKIAELGITPELKYQWNPLEEEIDVLAIVQCDPLEKDRELSLSEAQIQQLWDIFGDESLLSRSTGKNGDLSKVLVRQKLKLPVPPPPLKPSWYKKFLSDDSLDVIKFRSNLK
jgi:hypothetical protein